MIPYRIAKALIRLRGCTGWSGPSLSAYIWRHVFAWHGQYYSSFGNINKYEKIYLGYVCQAKTQINLLLSCVLLGFETLGEVQKHFDKLSPLQAFQSPGPRPVNRDVCGHSQTKANFPFCNDNFRWRVANICKLFSSCLLAKPRWRLMRLKLVYAWL